MGAVVALVSICMINAFFAMSVFINLFMTGFPYRKTNCVHSSARFVCISSFMACT